MEACDTEQCNSIRHESFLIEQIKMFKKVYKYIFLAGKTLRIKAAYMTFPRLMSWRPESSSRGCDDSSSSQPDLRGYGSQMIISCHTISVKWSLWIIH